MADYRQTGYGAPASSAGAAMDYGLRSYSLQASTTTWRSALVTAVAAYALFSASFVEKRTATSSP